MSSVVLFELEYRGDVWRLEVVTHNGRTFCNWRKWYRVGQELRPTKQGMTFSVERLYDLQSGVNGQLSGLPQK